jgi:uncharacterized protein YifN (PemK superfamily)
MIEPCEFSVTVDELCARHGLIKPSRRNRLIQSTPRVAQYFWVDFPHDAYQPEFVGEHPGIVIRAARTLQDTCIIVPVTSTPQRQAKHTHKLHNNPNPQYRDREVWAVCDHLYTIHTARLRPVKADRLHAIYPRVSAEDMSAIYACIRDALPNVFPVPEAIAVISEVESTKILVNVND